MSTGWRHHDSDCLEPHGTYQVVDIATRQILHVGKGRTNCDKWAIAHYGQDAVFGSHGVRRACLVQLT